MKALFNLLCFILLFTACNSNQKGVDSKNEVNNANEILYFNGDILTMEGEVPKYVQAVAVKEGEFAFVGSFSKAEKKFPDARKVNLAGKTLLPGFIDAHGHAWISGFQALAANLLPPPDGPGRTIPALIEAVNKWKVNNEKAIGKVGWIIGFGYDNAQMEEQRHPLASELDAISNEYPVLVIHQSGHLAVMNHKALELSGYTAEAPNPKGGAIRRVEGSQEPDGLLEEMAFF